MQEEGHSECQVVKKFSHVQKPEIKSLFSYPQVSMATFKLSKVEFIQQSCDYSSVIKIQVSNIDNDECSSIPWDEFQVSQITFYAM